MFKDFNLKRKSPYRNLQQLLAWPADIVRRNPLDAQTPNEEIQIPSSRTDGKAARGIYPPKGSIRFEYTFGLTHGIIM